MNKKLLSHLRGFSLIEILVVIGIISILSSVILFSVSEARSQSRDKARQVDLKQLELALELYREANGEYPDAGCGRMPSGSNGHSSWTGKTPHHGDCDEYISGLAPTFIPALPVEKKPLNGNNSGYLYRVRVVDNNNIEYKILSHNSVETGVINKGEPLARCPDIPACTNGYCSQRSYAVYSQGASCW